METIGERVRARRQQLGLTLDAVGEELGVSRQAVHQLERAGDDMRVQRVQDLARALQCRLVWLLSGTGPVTGRIRS